jgi:large subunit ribosomal protein L25
MELLVLDAKIRDTSEKAGKVRNQGLIPAICYGRGFENFAVQVEYQNFRKLYKQTGSTQVFNLNVDGKKLPVLIHEIAYNPLSDRFDHIDFLQIDMKQKVTATVPVEVTGVSPAVKNFNALITMVKSEIEVECLPMDIPHEITVDVSKLENIGDTIYVKDLNLGSKVEVKDDPESPVVSVNAAEEYKEEVAEVPEEMKAEPVAPGAEGAAEGEGKKEEKAE